MHYLVFMLSGAYVQDTQTTGLWGAIYESPTTSWRADVCAQFDIPIYILPQVHPPATIVGGVHAEAATETGLLEGTPVIAGLPDLTASLIAAGVVNEDETCVYYGTAGLVPIMKDNLLNGVLKPYPVSEKGTTPQDGYIYDYPAYCLSVGEAVRWFRDQFGQAELALQKKFKKISAYDQLNALAENVPPGCDGLMFLPYFEGQRSPWFDPYAKGLFFGMSSSHTKAHFYRAIQESFGYIIRHGFETFYPQGHPLSRVVATGGGAKSPLWRQIVSDITGFRQEYVPEAEGAIGSAYVAGIAIGWYQDFEPLRNDWVKVEAHTEPDKKTQPIYDNYFPVFRDLHQSLKTNFIQHHETQNRVHTNFFKES
jgi:xylulokinase